MQIAQFLGAVAILAAFFLSQRRLLPVDGYPYLVLNLGGSVLLAASALDGTQWGFLLLNTTWGAVAAWGLLRRLSSGGQHPTAP